MHSALYTGRLRHVRYAPRHHAFAYRHCMLWLDLAEVDEVFLGRWFWSTKRRNVTWLKRSDFLGDPAMPLDAAVRDMVERQSGTRPRGPVRLLTRLRTFGHCFNPVSFYYCYDVRGEQIEAIVAEVTNTPWNERHAYVLLARDSVSHGQELRFCVRKCFHVSPFMPMDIDYDWRFGHPGTRLVVHMTNRRDGEALFDETLALVRHEITGASLAGALLRFHIGRFLVLGAIHWQALQLWIKRTPFYSHPGNREEGNSE
jgi:uncharacterized protein